MKKKKNTLSFVLIIFACSVCFSQGNQANLEKYWHYRYRLVNYFMSVGGGQGQSLPAGIRNMWNGGRLHFGDTPLYLGWYIGTLATEYKLLSDNGQPLNQTILELHYALAAVERLDFNSDIWYGYSGSVNGHLIRDDVPANFITLHPELNMGNIDNTPGINFGSGEVRGATEIASDWVNSSSPTISNDQIIHLLMGFALVKKFVPNSLNFIDLDGITNITTNPLNKVIFLADKIISWEKSPPNNGNVHWQLVDPNGVEILVEDGGDGRPICLGLADAGELITGTDYHDFQTDVEFKFLWQNQQNLESLRQNTSSIHMALALASIANNWKNGSGDNTTAQGISTQGNYPAGVAIGVGTYPANQQHWDVFYHCLHDVLHNYVNTDFCVMQDMLNLAPYDGPFSHSSSDKAPNGWAASRKFVDAPNRQDNGNYDFRGNYNGLDYMLMHNLYYINENNANNYDIVRDSGPMTVPTDGGDRIYPNYYTIKTQPGLSGRLVVDNLNVFPFGGCKIIGGSRGVLLTSQLTGYNSTINIQPGSFFEVTIDPFDCAIDKSNYIFDPSWYHRYSSNVMQGYEVSSEEKTKFDMVNLSNSIITYPNPVNDYINIEISLKKKSRVLGLLQSSTGQFSNVIIESVLDKGRTLIKHNLSSVAAGIYYLSFYFNDFVVNKKIVITK